MIRPYLTIPRFDDGLNSIDDSILEYNLLNTPYSDNPQLKDNYLNELGLRRLQSQLLADRASQLAAYEQLMENIQMDDNLTNYVNQLMQERKLTTPVERTPARRSASPVRSQVGRSTRSGSTTYGTSRRGETPVTPSTRNASGTTTANAKPRSGYTSQELNEVVSRMKNAGSVQGAQAVLNDRTKGRSDLRSAARAVYNQRLRENRAKANAAKKTPVTKKPTTATVVGDASKIRRTAQSAARYEQAVNPSNTPKLHFYGATRYGQLNRTHPLLKSNTKTTTPTKKNTAPPKKKYPAQKVYDDVSELLRFNAPKKVQLWKAQ